MIHHSPAFAERWLGRHSTIYGRKATCLEGSGYSL